MKDNLKESYKQTKAYHCLECGKCSSACPVSLTFDDFSPRLIVKKALLGFEDDLFSDKLLWECLTCNLCNDVCMSDVEIPEFIRTVREEALALGNEGTPSHCDVPHAVSRLMAYPKLKQNRLFWLTEDMKTSQTEGEYLFWVGCTPYFNPVFSEFDEATDVTRVAVKLLNHFGIEPVVLPDERCCGHDMFWMGRTDTFDQLKEQNIKAIEASKAKRIVTTCAEGYYTLKNLYDLDCEVLHITQFLAQKITENGAELKDLNMGAVTYHDPCRLGRFAKIYEEPRKILETLPGVELVEMERNKHKSPCCGVSAWMNCNDFSKEMRFKKLDMAQRTGAHTLVTACPKCRIHLRCYTSNQHVKPQINMDVEDITLLVARSLGIIEDKKVRA
jgi:Fe-S oxidoreductase